MSTVKQDRSMSRHLVCNFFFTGVPFLALIAGSILGWFSPFIAIPIALPIALIGAFWQYRVSHYFRCPTCSAMLYRDDGPAGSDVTFHCEECDTIWSTSVQEGENWGGD